MRFKCEKRIKNELFFSDRRYVLKKSPALINEMVNVISQLVASCMARQSKYG